jgi:hypothetical protein
MMTRISSVSEKPISDHSRRLVDWINPTGAGKVHSLVDKVYKILVNLISLIPSLSHLPDRQPL